MSRTTKSATLVIVNAKLFTPGLKIWLKDRQRWCFVPSVPSLQESFCADKPPSVCFEVVFSAHVKAWNTKSFVSLAAAEVSLRASWFIPAVLRVFFRVDSGPCSVSVNRDNVFKLSSKVSHGNFLARLANVCYFCVIAGPFICP